MRARLAVVGVTLAVSATLACAAPAPAAASVWKPVCRILGVATPFFLNPCNVAHHLVHPGMSLVRTGGELASGNLGGAVQSVANGATSVALGAVASWATAGAQSALDETAHLIAASTSPRLAAPWFTAIYWRFAGMAVLLTLPFLFAAALQALLRSDPGLLVRSAFGYLPLAMLGVAVAAQLTALLLAATDELCAAVSGVAGNAAPAFLARAGTYVAALSFADQSPFLALLVAAFTVAGAIVLWLELVVRAAAVYVIVVMLPLAFAGLVWPARRIWALRAVELLMALILSKLAIVAVLTLGGTALAQHGTAAAFITGLTLLLLGAFAPWAMLRFVPFAELAAGAANRLRAEAGTVPGSGMVSQTLAFSGHEWASEVAARMRRDAYPQDAQAAARSQLDALHDQAGNGSPGSATPTDGSSPVAGDEAGEAAIDLRSDLGEGDRRISLLPEETGPNGERRPGMAARWQAANGAWQTLQLGNHDGWSPVTWIDDGPDPASDPGPDPASNTRPDPASNTGPDSVAGPGPNPARDPGPDSGPEEHQR